MDAGIISFKNKNFLKHNPFKFKVIHAKGESENIFIKYVSK